VDPLIGTLLADRYRIDTLVGEGGMGRVYSAEHVLMRKRLAVKVLRRELTRVPEVVARFEREAMAAGNIEHPNVAAATDFGKLPDGSVFLVLEFVSGHSLRDEIARGPFEVDRALHIARQISSALSAAHAQGIVHRDLKPENVMLVERNGDPNFVKVLDFGIAKVPLGEAPGAAPSSGNPITKAGMVFGTPEYMAPEQALGQSVDGRADLYALGVILFEMLSGVRPFTSQSSVGILGQQLSKPTPTFAERSPGLVVPPSAEQITLRLLSRDASARFQSAPELSRAIDVLLAPIPGQGVYRYTLSDGSRSSPGAADAKPAMLDPLGDPNQALSALPGQAPWPRGQVAGAVARRLVRRAQQWLNEGVRAIDRARHRLPPRLRDAVRPVPTPALVIASALCVLLGAWAIISGLRGVSRPAGQPSPAVSLSGRAEAQPTISAPPATLAQVSERELEDARKSGVPALEALAGKYPTDPRIALEIARAALAAKDYVAAASAVARTLKLDASFSDNKQLASILFQTAQMKAASDASFALLFGPMGRHGPDVAYDLAATEGVKPWVRARADQGLRSADFSRMSTPPLAAAVALRFATTCAERYALLPRAADLGDERALGYLNLYRATTGCGRRGKDDCYPCLRVDSRLDDAILAIKQRTHH